MVRKAHLAAAIALALALHGPARAAVERVTRPAVGEEVSREIGEPLVEVELIRTIPGARLTSGHTARLPIGGRIEFDASELVAQGSGFCGPGTLYDVLGIPYSGRQCATGAALRRAGTTFEPIMIATDDPTNFRQQLLYQGRSGSTIRLSYREFVGDLARPAFTQDLTFDIADDPVVGVKGARLEVVEATNVSITYRLFRPFDPGP